jgi:hypothetical protein
MAIGLRLASCAVGSLLLLGCASTQPRQTGNRVPLEPYEGPTDIRVPGAPPNCRRATSVSDEDIRQRHDPETPMHMRGTGRCVGRGL